MNAARISLAAVTAGQVQPPAQTGGTWVGAHRTVALAQWKTMSQSFNNWTVTRTFPWPPDTIFTSFEGKMNPDVRTVPAIIWPTLETRKTGIWQEFARGDYDTQMVQLANWFPKDRVSYFTIQHEWEYQMFQESTCGTAADYAAMYRHIYPIMKAANPALRIVPISSSYAWGHQKTFGDLTQGWMGADCCDGLALDVYWSASRGTPGSMFTHEGFNSWYNWAKTKGVPLHITEWGYDAFGGVPARAQYMAEFGNWAIDQGFETLQYWNSTTGAGGVPNTATYSVDDDPLATQVLKDLGLRGRPFSDALL